jgi:hypothetical protein
VNRRKVVFAAAARIGRADDPEPNVEYDRALVDLTCDLLGLDAGIHHQEVQDFLLSLARLMDAMDAS